MHILNILVYLFEAKFTRHKIHHFKVNSSVAFKTFTMFCDLHLYLVPEHFHPPKKKPRPHEQSPSSPLPQPLATTNALSVPVDLPVLDVSYKWNHTLCGLWCLASLTEHYVLKVHSHCSECHCFSPFSG